MPSPAELDLAMMRRCLELAERAAGRTSPNPMVGCVIVGPRGRVLAEGFHERAGAPHAEAVALAKLGGRAPGATLYVNLEPCAHVGHTPACAPLVAQSGIQRLVVGLADPFPGHGGGAARVRRAGIRVDGPILEEECRRANEAFLCFATLGRAHVTLKAAMTLDGKIATRTGQSRWITGEPARADAHALRNRVDAILVGSGTVRADDPLLTTRGVPGGRDAVRIVLDGRLRMSPRAQMLRAGSTAPTLICTTREAPRARARALEAAGATVLFLPGRKGRVSLRALLRALPKREVLSVLVEGGAETHAEFLQAGLCDRLRLYVAPLALGGAAPAWLGGVGAAHLSSAAGFVFEGPPMSLGSDLLLQAVPRPRRNRRKR
jgi:diaminohydroxyphosphoribosylaminopyrimidine deaminase/5-amino-6-(5-phosphoribosylamino)uracil reductase